MLEYMYILTDDKSGTRQDLVDVWHDHSLMHHGTSVTEEEKVELAANTLAEEGWRLVSVVPAQHKSHTLAAFFEREKK